MSPRAPEERTPRKAPLPKTRGEIKHHKPVDRIEQNRVEAQKPLPPKPKARVTKVAKASPRKHENFGHVPAYLDQRKRQLRAEAEAKKALLPDPQCPDGDAHAGRGEIGVVERFEEKEGRDQGGAVQIAA